MKRIGLFIVDMLNDFRDGALPNPRMEIIIPHLLSLIQKLKIDADCRIFFLCDSHAPDDPEFKLFPPHCLKGSAGAEIIPELKPFMAEDRGNVIYKNKYSAFFGTGLDQVLEKEKLDAVVIGGVLTEICVMCNAIDFRYRGYDVCVPEACVETYDAPGVHDAEEINRRALGYMKDVFGVKVIPKNKNQ